MYLCFVDESGTHGGSPAMVVAGLIIHEEDAWHLQQRLDAYLYRKLLPLGHDHTRFEIHATEVRQGARQWAVISQPDRYRILAGAYAALAGYSAVDRMLPWRLVGAVMQRDPETRKLRAYELVTKKFDDFVSRVSTTSGTRQRGLIIHDRSGVEGTLQSWTNQWRLASSSLGRLRNLADVPLFADSRATRALQAADLVAYALYRHYSTPPVFNDQYTKRLWSMFDAVNGRMHGLIHDCQQHHSCACPACTSRRPR